MDHSQSSVSRPRLPLEIQEHVLNHLHADVRALQACCLACSAWIPTTRLHLFHTVKLTRARDCLRFLATLESTSDSGEGGPSASVGVLVRKLHLPMMSLREKGMRRGRRYDLVRQIMRRLPNVEVLDFHEFDSEGFMELITPVGPDLTISSAIAAVFNFPRLKALFLRFLYLQFGAELLGFPAAFPHLEVLQVCSISWKQLPVNLVTGHARHDGPGRRLRELHVRDHIYGPDYLASLLEGSATFVSQLRKLCWGRHYPSPLFARLLFRAAGTLRELEFDIQALQDPPAHNSWPELHSLEHLRLNYTLHRGNDSDHRRAVFSQIVSILGLQAVREIGLRISAFLPIACSICIGTWDPSQDWELIDWGSMNESLLSLHHTNPAATITFIFAVQPATYRVSALAKAVATRLQRAVEAGLQITVSGSNRSRRPLVLTPEMARAR